MVKVREERGFGFYEWREERGLKTAAREILWVAKFKILPSLRAEWIRRQAKERSAAISLSGSLRIMTRLLRPPAGSLAMTAQN